MGTITAKYKGDMLFETNLGSHTCQVDVPASMGGKDRAPTPPEFFLNSLATCVAAFVTNYCNQNGIDATGLYVELAFDKVEHPTRFVNLAAHIHLPNGDFKKREAALRRVAEHCPVHETIAMFDGFKIDIAE